MVTHKKIIPQLLELSAVHEEWFDLLQGALSQVNYDYIQQLLEHEDWLPGKRNLFAAFRRDLKHCNFILFGESPYPRRESANGIAFYDAAVSDIWSNNGLSKGVNRATSLRNIVKTALVAQQLIQPMDDGKIPQSLIAELDKQGLVSNISELFDNLQQLGFLLFNATPVLHQSIKPVVEARYWTPFIDQLLQEITLHKSTLPTLVLWGRIAHQMESVAAANNYKKIIGEHPYNLSFIQNPDMLKLFAELNILQKNE